MEESLITDADCQKILSNKFKHQNFDLVDFKLTPFSEDVLGFMGEHYLLEIFCNLDGSINNEKFFVKAKPQKYGPQSQDHLKKVHYFKKETYFYSTLLKNFEDLGIDIRFAPRCYYCTKNQSLVMENMKETRYRLLERQLSFDLEHCREVLKSTAAFHASSLIYEEIMSKKLGREYRLDKEMDPEISEEDFFSVDPEKPCAKYFQVSMKSFIELSKLLSKNDAWKTAFEEKLGRFNIQQQFHTGFAGRKTLGHGDLWTNNILFRYSDARPIHAVLVDFQSLRYFHPIFDFLLIVYTNTEKNFRDKYFNVLLNLYFVELGKILESFELKVESLLTKVECLKVVEGLKSVALIQAAADRTFTMLPTEITNNVASVGDDLQNLIFTEKRIPLITEAFKNDERYRSCLTDYILELDEMLS